MIQPLQINNSYTFLVKKEIYIFGIGKQFVMQAKDGNRHLMPVEPYKDYSITIGEEINCYIDKINCTGKVFLEPEHPFYKRGEVYKFKIVEISNKFYKRGKYRIKLFVNDYKGNTVEAIPYDFDFATDFSKKTNCKVAKLKKGKLVLTNKI